MNFESTGRVMLNYMPLICLHSELSVKKPVYFFIITFGYFLHSEYDLVEYIIYENRENIFIQLFYKSKYFDFF